MKKTANVVLQYRNGTLPEHWTEVLRNADENDLRILTTVLMLSDGAGGTTSAETLSTCLELSQAEVDASLKFWRGAGILSTEGSAEKRTAVSQVKNEVPAEEKPALRQTAAHRNGVLEHSGVLGQYTSSELAELTENRAGFVNEAQRMMGKIFRMYDTGVLMGMVDQLGFEEEAVLAILAYAVHQGKKTVRYAEKIAMSLYDRGVTETAAVLEQICRMERAGEVTAQIRSLFGMGARELTASEKKMFEAWIVRYAYDIDVIRMAYDITVDNIQKPVPKYTNSILEKWYTEGLHTAEEVRRYLEQKKSGNGENGVTVTKSYDTEEFFEAALQRSYEHLK